MASKLSWLSTCKSNQLKALATAVGVNSSGTKPLLTSQLLEHLPKGYFNYSRNQTSFKAQYDIISIDMGIRNLAYCRLILPESKFTTKSHEQKYIGNPAITEWARIEMSKRIPKPAGEQDPRIAVKEAFDPLTYSHHAYTLVNTLLNNTPNHPTHILIERQRFRSMGGSSVQEWTLRVNMFEAMIYAVLKSFSERGDWRGSVHPVAPAKVAKFWLGEKQGAELEGTGTKSENTKGAKISVVGRWLEEKNSPFQLEGQAKEMGERYLLRRKVGKRNKSKGREGPVEIGKLDDLADCLLQGMAWIQWEKNRRLIMSSGIGALGEMGT
ncbi:hypothetical protein N7G274_004718 [Stereocaulon virgatum]|uniref:SAP domain-containing protein n=1 Tax=Stereocaulon virgatum TaxID=373712 RepID=A0ABR4A8Y1_9LECA